MEATHRLGGHFVAMCEPDYPMLLRRIASPPPLIAVRGNFASLRRSKIAIVGARNASAAGLAFTEQARESFEPSQVDCPPHSPRIGEARPAEQPLADVAARVAELLGPVPVSVDELARLAGSPARRVRSVLIELELAGRIEWHGGGLVSSVSEPEE
jgi:predicted Rossmann fold nucleotide-binding protein DprA/Smf involved in DNA uptake